MINSGEILNFYREKLSQHGPSAEGVGWRNQEAQEVRFQQLIKIINSQDVFTINDLGCGTGDLLKVLKLRFEGKFTYRGYDELEEMISAAKRQYPETDSAKFFRISGYEEMQPCDYAVASGIFNVRNGVRDGEWKAYILATITAMSKSSTKGFAFNALTRYSDTEHMRPELFYSDPLELFDFCKTKFSRNVALLHDYDIFDFTILVKKS